MFMSAMAPLGNPLVGDVDPKHNVNRRQSISTAFKNCNINIDQDEHSQCAPMVQDAVKPASRMPIDLPIQPSQDLMQSQLSQDFYSTPVEQQFHVEYDVSGNNSGAAQHGSPKRFQKRPRHLSDAEQDTASQQSHSSRSVGEPSTSSRNTSGLTGGPARVKPPKPQRGRARSPMFKNAFISEAETESTSQLVPKQKFPLSHSRLSTEYRVACEIGSGNFSKVFKARHRIDGCEYAIKRSKDGIINEPEKQKWLQEVQVMASAGVHPNIVRYFSAWAEQESSYGAEHLYIQMELCEGNLSSLLGTHFEESELVELCRQMASALQHLHSKGIVHMDVKPDNIYRAGDGTYKLGDFGLATKKTGPVVDEGDSRYISLELMNNKHDALDKADMFALGITLYELASGQPLPTCGQRYESLRKKPVMLPHYTQPFMNMLSNLMKEEPIRRPSAEALLKSSVLRSRQLVFTSTGKK